MAAALGVALVAARAEGVPWKVLQQQTGYGRTRLWMLWRAALAHAGPAAEPREGEAMFMNIARIYGSDAPVSDERELT